MGGRVAERSLLPESSNLRILRWEGGTEAGERALGSSEPRRVLERADFFRPRKGL